MSNGNTTWTYTYDAGGLRTKRTDGSTAYTYSYYGDKMWQYTVDDQAFYITYDALGAPWALYTNGTIYYYITNLQGDVIAILNDAGNTLVTYAYDAWGNLISMTDTSGCGIGTDNVLRYRGYVYDTETGLYYLQSRYYNPEIGRFINADGVMSGVGGDVRGYNLFAYCMNNPVNMSDFSGNWPKWIKNAANAIKTGVNQLTTGIKNELSKVDFKEAVNKGKQVIKAAYTNIDASIGVGLGLYGEKNIADVVGLGFGINYNLIELKLDDGKFTVQQSYNEGLSASVLFIDVLQGAKESGSRELPFSSPMGDFVSDDYNSNWTIDSTGAYFIAGGSWYIGFDMISFCQEIDVIFFYPD